MKLFSDYAQLPWPHHVWPSPEAFAAAPALAEGVHSVTAGELPVDILLLNPPLPGTTSANASLLPIYFSGAVEERSGKAGPFFSGVGLTRTLGGAAVCIADPSLALDGDLGLAWYAGSRHQASQETIHQILRGLGERYAAELLLIGGSGGGFAALYHGARLGEHATVLAWNPQTSIVEYEAGAIRRYVAAAWDGQLPDPAERSTFKQAASAMLDAAGVEHALAPIYARGARPRRLVWLQSATDWHVAPHASPLLASMQLQPIADGFHGSAGGDAVCWFGSWGRGHVPPPKALVHFMVDWLRQPQVQAADLPAVLAQSEFAEFVDASQAPLRWAHLPVRPQLEVSALLRDGELCIRATLPGVPPATGQVSYACYLYAGGERIGVHWYQRHSEWRLHVQGKAPDRVVVFAKDGFGDQLAPVSVGVEPAPPRVFVIGSCVSRDAFEFARPCAELTSYVARSSFGSAFDTHAVRADWLDHLPQIASEFQRRMVRIDLKRQLPELLSQTPHDLNLVDLIDERFSLLLTDGARVTVSSEFLRLGQPIDRQQLIPFGSDEHMRAWSEGFDRYARMIDPAKVVINRVFWASRTDAGEELEDQPKIRASNEALARMYNYIDQRHGFRGINYPPHLLVADPNHKWGISPFHYIRPMYQFTMDELSRIVSE